MPWLLPSPPSPPDSAPWPRGTAARPPLVAEHSTEVVVRRGLVGPQGDGLAVAVLFRGIPCAISHKPNPLVARLRGEAGRPLRGLAIPLLPRPTILLSLPRLPQVLVERPVQLPSARVRRAVDTAEIRRRQLLVEAHIADRVLVPLVVHVYRQPEAADASEAQRHGQGRAALDGSGRRGGGGLGSLALRLQHLQRLADLLGGRSQVRLLLPQLGEQRLEAEGGLGHAQSAHGLEEGLGRAGFAHATRARARARRAPRREALFW
eukprot:scaffold16007_cov65-Phaeocystis_antarctica.AAC.4